MIRTIIGRVVEVLIAMVMISVLIAFPIILFKMATAPDPAMHPASDDTTIHQASTEWFGLVTVSQGKSQSSGFVVGPSLVVTAGHAVRGEDILTAGSRPATIVKLDLDLDLALLKVPGITAPAARFATTIRVNDPVWAVGYVPWMGQPELVIHRGWVADIDFGRFVLLGGFGQPGMSGCPVVNERAEVVGMLASVSMAWGRPNPTNILIVPADVVRDFIEEELSDDIPRPDWSTALPVD